MVWRRGRDIDADRPDRRRVGALILVIAVLATLLISRLLAPGLPGRPARMALPVPPPVGACLLISADATTEVSCAEPHQAEVVQSWPAGSPPIDDVTSAADDTTRVDPLGEVGRSAFRLCWPLVGDYTGTASSAVQLGHLWVPLAPMLNYRLVKSSRDRAVGAWWWSACVVIAPDSATSIGSLRQPPGRWPTGWPSEFGNCVTTRVEATPVGCDQPHQVEVFGVAASPELFDESLSFFVLQAGPLHDSCVALARTLTGAADPTYGGRLDIRSEAIAPGSAAHESGLTDLPRCFAELSDPGALTATVVALGERALPVQ